MATANAHHDGRTVPLVHALTRRSRALTSPHLGAYGSFAAVVTWFQHLAAHLSAVHVRTALLPSVAYLGRSVAGAGRTRGRHALALQVARVGTGPVPGLVVGVEAGGGSLSVWLELDTGRVIGILGEAFLDGPAARERWCRVQRDAAMAWGGAVVGATPPRVRLGLDPWPGGPGADSGGDDVRG